MKTGRKRKNCTDNAGKLGVEQERETVKGNAWSGRAEK